MLYDRRTPHDEQTSRHRTNCAICGMFLYPARPTSRISDLGSRSVYGREVWPQIALSFFFVNFQIGHLRWTDLDLAISVLINQSTTNPGRLNSRAK